MFASAQTIGGVRTMMNGIGAFISVSDAYRSRSLDH